MARSETLEHLGPMTCELAVADLCDFAERVWEVYRAAATAHGLVKHGSRDYLIVRMLYLADVTSTAIRMNATWSLTPPGMSLLRDRYGQTVRFSWLVRNPDQNEFIKYEREMFGKINNLVRKLKPETIADQEKVTGRKLPPWATEVLTKDMRAKFYEWSSLDLRSMATKRDAFAPMDGTSLAKESLAQWYEAIYTQFSSVTHYDRFSIEMVRPVPTAAGSVSLSLGDHWPALLIFQSSLLDMIQCSEAVKVGFQQDAAIKFESLFSEWRALSRHIKSPEPVGGTA